VEALRKKGRGDETQFTTKIGGKLVWNWPFSPVIAWLYYNFHRVFLEVTLSLGLLSPPVPSLSEVLKARKFH
jgi:hypothetical protein